MKKKLMGIAIIFSVTFMLASCSEDTSNTTSSSVCEEDKEVLREIQSLVQRKAEDEVKFNNIDSVDLSNDGSQEYVVKYKSKLKDKPLRIAIIAKEADQLVIKDEIKNVGEDFVEVAYIDINSDGEKEIIAGFKAGEALSKGISIYKYKDGKTTEIFEEYYSEYIIKDIDENGKEDVILIKENEKDGKSYAYLYMWQRDGFKKSKKVEIDSTSDTKEDIFKKLQETEINQ